MQISQSTTSTPTPFLPIFIALLLTAALVVALCLFKRFRARAAVFPLDLTKVVAVVRASLTTAPDTTGEDLGLQDIEEGVPVPPPAAAATPPAALPHPPPAPTPVMNISINDIINRFPTMPSYLPQHHPGMIVVSAAEVMVPAPSQRQLQKEIGVKFHENLDPRLQPLRWIYQLIHTLKGGLNLQHFCIPDILIQQGCPSPARLSGRSWRWRFSRSTTQMKSWFVRQSSRTTGSCILIQVPHQNIQLISTAIPRRRPTRSKSGFLADWQVLVQIKMFWQVSWFVILCCVLQALCWFVQYRVAIVVICVFL